MIGVLSVTIRTMTYILILKDGTSGCAVNYMDTMT